MLREGPAGGERLGAPALSRSAGREAIFGPVPVGRDAPLGRGPAGRVPAAADGSGDRRASLSGDVGADSSEEVSGAAFRLRLGGKSAISLDS